MFFGLSVNMDCTNTQAGLVHHLSYCYKVAFSRPPGHIHIEGKVFNFYCMFWFTLMSLYLCHHINRFNLLVYVILLKFN